MDYKAFIETTRNQTRTLSRAAPELLQGFGALSKAAKGGPALDHKTKEFVALGIAIADRCDPCIALHIADLIKLQATREEVVEVLSVAVQMGGGPALMYAGKALDCWDQLSAS
jgi:AhpD family alkylhydroperoxidase